LRRALKQLASDLGTDPGEASAHADSQRERRQREREERHATIATIVGPASGSIEDRRRRIMELHEAGWSFRAIAEVVGVCRETVRADFAAASVRC
jgi:DNA-binding NarL/FixJ family response regulator